MTLEGSRRTIVVGVALTAVALTMGQHLAHAHESWISSHRFRDPASNAWCCNEMDCSALDEQRVRAVAGDFIVDNKYRVAGRRVLPSYDGHYWACFEFGGLHGHGPKRSVRCFFAPMDM